MENSPQKTAETDIYTSLIPYGGPATALGRIQGAGYLHERTGYLPWRVLGAYALVYLLEGRGQYEDASGVRLDVGAGDLLLLFPEIAHRYGPGKSEGPEQRGRWAELHALFEGRSFDLWRSAGLLDSRRPVWRLEPVAEWLPRLAAIAGPLGPASEADSLLRISRLLAVLTEASAAQDIAPLPAVTWLPSARLLLETDLSRDRTAAEVAAQLGVSYETFRKTFERHVGLSPARYRAGERFSAACTLLLHTAMTSRQIADRLGFPDESYFSRQFRRRFGLSPREYRRTGECQKPPTAPDTAPTALRTC